MNICEIVLRNETYTHRYMPLKNVAVADVVYQVEYEVHLESL